ncbi:tetratricopeptide repeat protein [Pyxidicoccus caerfyrddinensis]|uniref:tetratricopeptide repeat protein n=1 Tax=Pyxidicoccus caerfyrddinensis TaxID=2709663 RepID=UPI0013D9D67A|nr:toll/interleukin-1 receptor domain-containing protein [Pyxidicoccus caerfyrddinensis]
MPGHLPVFISYARETSRADAEALQRALGPDLAFLDSTGVQHGQRFPTVLVEALLGSRMVVAFLDEAYLTRWYCLWELRAALSPFLGLPAEASEKDRAQALSCLVLALPSEGRPAAPLERLPPRLRTLHWPRADQTEALARQVRARLAEGGPSLGERLEQQGRLDATRDRLLQESALPAPQNLAGLALHPLELPPSLGASFVGRADDLWSIDFALTTLSAGGGAGAALSGALEAAGGFGKTRLALEYLHRLGPARFPGGLFWVDAEAGEVELEARFHGILSTLEPGVPSLKEFREQQRDAAGELARALHARCAKAPVLYVVDNVPETAPGQRPRPLKTWCPALGKVALLATSRARLSVGGEGLQALPVATLGPEAAVVLLTEEVERSGLEATDWRLIAEWVGHLPLALELLNRAMRAGAITPAKLLEQARHVGPVRELDRQLEALRPHLPDGQLRGVTEALSISYERLTPEAQRAAVVLAQLAPVPIPEVLLEHMAPLFTPEVRVQLKLRSFVSGATAGRVPTFGAMHRVLADFLRGRAESPELALRAVAEALLSAMEPRALDDPNAWPWLDACAPHAKWVFDRTLASGFRQDLGLPLGYRLGQFRANRGLVGPAVDLLHRVVEQARVSLGAEHRLTLLCQNSLGDVLRQGGKLEEARKLLEETLEAQLRLYGAEDSETLRMINNLSITLADLGDARAARPLVEQVVESRRLLRGEEHEETLMAKYNLATILWDLDDVQGSRSLHEEVLGGRRKVLGDAHQDTMLSRAALSTTLRRMGDLDGARVMQEALLADQRRLLGEAHPDTMNTMQNLGVTLIRQKDFEAARGVWSRLVELATQVLGEDHPTTLDAQDHLRSLREQ